MKRVFFVRHAKSSWSDTSLSDIQRPLNKRGLRDAPFMAALLKGKGVSPDAIISSPAVRAHTTAKYFAQALLGAEDRVVLYKELYHAFPRDILDVIGKQPDDLNVILVFGHNPGFTSIANLFSKEYIGNVPTCGILEVEANIKKWSDLSEKNGTAVSFHYPKQYFL